jgi:enoyl-CoA hydratase/carnithine racemase/carbon monoxide dehydrogenase subunit G
MEMKGDARIAASRQVVWDALNAPEVLQKSITGCESLERTAENEFTATVVSKVGPIKARFAGKVTLSNIQAPRSYTLTGEGAGGAAGFAKADIEVALEALEPAVTLLMYTVKANVGGKLAQLGSRMIDAAARKAADEFFDAFKRQVDGTGGAGGSGSSASDMSAFLLAGAAGPASSPVVAPVPAARVPDAAAVAAGPSPSVTPVAAPTGATAPAAPVAAGAASQVASDDASEVINVLVAELIKVWISDNVAVVTMNRPSNRNAMTYGMWRAIPGIFHALERNPEVRAVILVGAGDDFCAGADIAEFESVRADVDQATAYEVAVDRCCDAIHQISKPTIAVMRGYCLGGGAHLAMSCDFRFAASTAQFGIPAAKLSILYGVKATRKLLSLVGLTQAKRILFSADRFPASEGLRIGFIDRIAGAGDVTADLGWLARLLGSKKLAGNADPMVDAREFAKTLSGGAPLSVAGAKHLLNGMAMGIGNLDLGHAEALIAQAAASADYREGRQAFAEKRTPRFQGR